MTMDDIRSLMKLNREIAEKIVDKVAKSTP